HLLIGDHASAYEVPAFLRFFGLHIEAAPDNGGVNNSVPLIDVQAVRSVTFVDPYLFSGPAPALSVDLDPLTTTGGVIVIGGTMLGKLGALTAFKPARHVDLIDGDEFTIIGTRL